MKKEKKILDFQSKWDLINKGRPTPEIKDLLQTSVRKINRSFQTQYFGKDLN